MAQIAAAGTGVTRRVSSRKVGEVSVTYTETASASVRPTGLQDLTETVYGLQLLSLLRLYGFGTYIR